MNISNLEIGEACKDMLRAAAVMPEKQSVTHVTKQAGFIFDKYHEPLKVAELELSEAKREFDELSKQLEKLRHERRKYDDPITNTPSIKKEQNDEQPTS